MKANEKGKGIVVNETRSLDPSFKTTMSVLVIVAVIVSFIVYSCLNTSDWEWSVNILALLIVLAFNMQTVTVIVYFIVKDKIERISRIEFNMPVAEVNAEEILSIIVEPMLKNGIRVQKRYNKVITVTYGNHDYDIEFIGPPAEYSIRVYTCLPYSLYSMKSYLNGSYYIHACEDIPVIILLLQSVLRDNIEK